MKILNVVTVFNIEPCLKLLEFDVSESVENLQLKLGP